ncbi:hypothetical protein ACQR50_04985 [Sphingomonas sp. Xoc002]|uniref:hypothetical protein n=1 Tax=Sphingomonas sp. Xoc002 TaxID=2837624 RepID=UPI003D174CF0
MLNTGKDVGAFTFAAINRACGDGIIILTNSDNGWRVVGRFPPRLSDQTQRRARRIIQMLPKIGRSSIRRPISGAIHG